MTTRQLAGAWFGALTILCGVAIAILRFAPPPASPFGTGEIAVVGSSLTLYAIPPRGEGEGSLLGDGRSHRRVSPNSLDEIEVLELAERAAESDARIVIVEANRLVSSMTGQSRERLCDNFQTGLRGALHRPASELGDAFRRLASPSYRLKGTEEAPKLDLQGQVISPRHIAAIYPLKLRDPSCTARWTDLARRMNDRDGELVLVLFPRSEASYAWQDEKLERELVSRARTVAEQLGVRLFAPEGPWPNSEFVDHGHVNAAGREHFLRELRQWWNEGT